MRKVFCRGYKKFLLMHSYTIKFFGPKLLYPIINGENLAVRHLQPRENSPLTSRIATSRVMKYKSLSNVHCTTQKVR